MTKPNGERVDRIPAWAKYSIQNKNTLLYEAVFWNPEEKFEWKSQAPQLSQSDLRIYEAHVGMVINRLMTLLLELG